MLGLNKIFNNNNAKSNVSLNNQWDSVKGRLRQIPEIVAPRSTELRAPAAAQTSVQHDSSNERVFIAGAQQSTQKKCSLVPEISRGNRLWDRKVTP